MSLACETEIGVQNELALRFTIVSKPTPTLEYIKSISSLVGASHILAVFEENDTLKVFFDDKKLVDTLIRSGIHVLGHHVRVDYVVPPGTKVVLSNIDPVVSNFDLTRLLSMYGAIVSPIICPPISDEMEYCHIGYGVRYCYMTINETIPNKLEFKYGDQLCAVKIKVADELIAVPFIKSDEFDVVETDHAPETSIDVESEYISPCPVVVSVESTAVMENTASMESTASVGSTASMGSPARVGSPASVESTSSVEDAANMERTASVVKAASMESAASVENVTSMEIAASVENDASMEIAASVENATSMERAALESSTDVHLGVVRLPIKRDYVQSNRSQETLKMRRTKVTATTRAAKRIKSSVKIKWIGKKKNKEFGKGKRGRKPLRLLEKSPPPAPLRLPSLSPTSSDVDDDLPPPLLIDNKKDIFKSPLKKEKLEKFLDECKGKHFSRHIVGLAKKYLGSGCDDDAMRSLINQIENHAKSCTSRSLRKKFDRVCRMLQGSLDASKS